MRTTPTVGGPDDPRIAKIREIRSRKPNFTRYQAFQSLGVAPKTMNKWIENGWVEPFPKLKKKTANSPWTDGKLKI